MFVYPRELNLQEVLEDEHIDLDTYQLRVKVYGEYILNQLGKQPKGLLLIRHVFVEAGHDKVHSLAVPYDRVALGVGNHDVFDKLDGLWHVEGWSTILFQFIWERAMEVQFDLMEVGIWVVRERIKQVIEVILILHLMHAMLCPTAHQPQPSSHIIW